MDINNIDLFVTKKKAEGKRVALYDGADIGLPGTVAVVDYEGGYYPCVILRLVIMRIGTKKRLMPGILIKV